MLNLTDTETLRDYLETHHIAPSKAMGQNFLVSPEVVEATLVALGDTPSVTELGPGAGALTQGLLASGKHVKAIEKDDDFARLLPSTVPPNMRERLDVIHDDLRNTEWFWDSSYCLVGNIPYNLSGYIIRRITELTPGPECAIILVQKEVGIRMRALAPDMSLMSLAIALWGQAQLLMNVPKSCFWPQPDVASQLILLTPHTPAKSPSEIQTVMDIARPLFQQKRKQIGGLIQKIFSVSPEVLETHDINPQMRPQELSVTQWYTISELCSDAQSSSPAP